MDKFKIDESLIITEEDKKLIHNATIKPSFDQYFTPVFYYTKDDTVKLPEYANPFEDAGMDIYSNEDTIIEPQETKLISTGLFFQIPIGYEIQIRPRSGLSLNTPLRLANCVGTIDSGYRGELKVIMTNTSFLQERNEIFDLTNKGNKHGSYQIKKYDRIAQIVLNKIEFMRFEKKVRLDESSRNEGGFGSTGV